MNTLARRAGTLWICVVCYCHLIGCSASAREETKLRDADPSLTNGWWHLSGKPGEKATIGLGFEAIEDPYYQQPFIRTSVQFINADTSRFVFHLWTNWIVVPLTNGVPLALEVEFLARSERGNNSVNVLVIQPDPRANPADLPALFVPKEFNIEIPSDGSWYSITGRVSLCDFTNYSGGSPIQIDQSPRAHPLIFGLVQSFDGQDAEFGDFDYAAINLCLVSEPPLSIVHRQNKDGTLTLSWRSAPDRRYVLVRSRNITSGEWDFVAQTTADSTVTTFEVSTARHEAEFFRVEYAVHDCE